MKKLFIVPIIMLVLMSFTSDSYKKIGQDSFAQGERLKYRVHYGFVNAGEAVMEISPKLYKVNNRVCYKATVSGKSTGAFDLMLRIRDTWGSYIDSGAMIPQKSFRTIEEGKYRLKETVTFNYAAHRAEMESDRSGNLRRDTLAISDHIQDMVSGYFYLRTLDYNKLHPGDTIKVDAVFEESLYDFKLKYVGKGMVSTKFGKIKGILLTPIMPDNTLFKGGESIKFWISDDKNKVPLKIEADMFLGAVAMDLVSYEGLRHPVSFSKK